MEYNIDSLLNRRIRGAVYDLDGTIADSMEAWQDIYRELFSSLDIPYDRAFLKEVNHIPMNARARLIAEKFSPNRTQEEIMSLWRKIVCAYYDGVSLKPRVLTAIKEQAARGMILSVATATDVSCCLYFLEEKGIGNYFSSVTGLNEAARPKNFPDVYLLAAEKSGLRAEECAVFEDSLVAIKGAKSGGFCTVGVWDKSSERDRTEIRNVSDYYLE